MITTVVGNYPKVAEGAYSSTLIGAITKWQRKELTDAQLEQTFQQITRAVIREQEQAGLDVLTDGQIRWEDLLTPIARHLEGFEINGLERWYNNNVYYRRPVLHKTPVWKKPILVEPFRFAAGCTRKPVKAVLPGPYTFARMSEDRFYRSEKKFAMKMAEILNAEAKALEQAGASLIQFDEPSLAYGAPDVKVAVAALNVATKGLKARTAVATYFGSLNGAFAPLMKAHVDIIGVDVVSDPSALSALKKAKITKPLAIGCMDARNTKLESVKELQSTFKAIRRLLPNDQWFVNPNCGLEFLPHGNALAKIQRLTEAVRSYR